LTGRQGETFQKCDKPHRSHPWHVPAMPLEPLIFGLGQQICKSKHVKLNFSVSIIIGRIQ
jgi:hypothetical protein